MTTPNNMFPNVLHADRWQCNFSNMPSMESMRDMRIFDLYVKNFTMPSYALEQMFSDYKGMRIRHPVGGVKINENLEPINIDFKASEDMRNYIYMFEWMRALKYGHIEDFSNQDELFRKQNIKSININILDNEKRTIATWKFTEAQLINLGSLNLEMGLSSEVLFSCTFSYEEIKYETKNVFGS